MTDITEKAIEAACNAFYGGADYRTVEVGSAETFFGAMTAAIDAAIATAKEHADPAPSDHVTGYETSGNLVETHYAEDQRDDLRRPGVRSSSSPLATNGFSGLHADGDHQYGAELNTPPCALMSCQASLDNSTVPSPPQDVPSVIIDGISAAMVAMRVASGIPAVAAEYDFADAIAATEAAWRAVKDVASPPSDHAEADPPPGEHQEILDAIQSHNSGEEE